MQIKKSTPESVLLKLGYKCSKCGKCCTYGSGFLTGKDIKRISSYLNITEKELVENCLEQVKKFNTTMHRPLVLKGKKTYGNCVFYNQNSGCMIHEVKPMNCRIANCSEYGEDAIVWFALNHFVNPDDPESVRQWSIYLKTGGKNIPGGSLNELVPDEEKLMQILDYKIL